ncbi:MAG: hypothetical protein IJ593_02605 [Lachnospiraceae bacterium]|nr:hypothetical protein [Lachnospiraceae bacterium]
MNKKLVKRVAVASLAALMTIPNLNVPINNVNTVYADIVDWDAVYAKQIKEAEEKVEYYKSIGNESQVKQWQKKVEIRKRRNEERKQEEAELNAKNAQIEEQRQAKAVEAERIANKVYPLEYNGKTIYYVKDFIEYVRNTTELNNGQAHWYEAADMPGYKFHLRVDDMHDNVYEDDLNITAEPLSDFAYAGYKDPINRLGQEVTEAQRLRVTYISPFEGTNITFGGSVWAPIVETNGKVIIGWDGYVPRGKVTRVFMRVLDMRYGDGWPEGYKGITIGSLNDPNINWRGQTKNLPRSKIDFVKSDWGASHSPNTETSNRDASKPVEGYFEILFEGGIQ